MSISIQRDIAVYRLDRSVLSAAAAAVDETI